MRIVEAASTLRERIEGGFTPAGTHAADSIESRLERWLMLVAKGDRDIFAKRLAWDNIDLETMYPFLGAVRFTNGKPLPGWSHTLAKILEPVSNTAPTSPWLLDPDRPIPFEDVLSPAIAAAIEMLECRKGDWNLGLNERPQAALQRRLLASLAFVASQTLQFEFEKVRAGRRGALFGLLAAAAGDGRRQLYDDFAEDMLGGGLQLFVDRYPMVGRLLAEEVDRWVDATAEMLFRLANDRMKLQHRFAGGAELGPVTEIEPGVSDPHNRGRAVAKITFGCGLRIVYKPRPVDLEAAFSQLLFWLEHRGSPLSFKTLDVLERPGYGWVRFVDHLPCQDREEARRFYRRAGMLLAVLHGIAGRDIHYENIIACGEHPVLVDLETVFHHEVLPEASSEQLENPAASVDKQPGPSVLDTNLLPFRFKGPRGGTSDLSGLGHVRDQLTTYQEAKWENVNTDNMSVGLGEATISTSANVPTLEGQRLRPGDYAEEIIGGFRTMYGILVKNRESLLGKNGPLGRFESKPVRIVMRASQVYSTVLTRAVHPRNLRSGVDFGIELDVLCAPLMKNVQRPHLWPLLGGEVEALERLDVPYFTASTDSESLDVSQGNTIERCFSEPSYDLVVKRLRNLDEDDLEGQIETIRTSLESASAGIPE